MKNKLGAYLYLTLAMFLSGSAVVVSKMMVSTLPTFLATELGLLVGLFILLPVTFVVKKERSKLDLKSHGVLFAQALCGIVLYRIFIFVGLKFTTAATSGLITSASPVLVVLFAYFLIKEKIGLQQVLGAVCAVTGLLIINLHTYYTSSAAQSSIKGNLLVMAAVICEALFSVLSKVRCKRMSALYRTTILAFYAFLLLLPFAVRDARAYDFHRMNSATIFCVLYYGVFISYLSYIFWFKGIEKVSASNAAVYTAVVPISSILLSALILKEAIGWAHMISLVCIIAGIWISSRTAEVKQTANP